MKKAQGEGGGKKCTFGRCARGMQEGRPRMHSRDQVFAEQVSPGVCVGGEKVARDRALLRRSGVTHVVNCVGMLVPECFPQDFRYLTLYLRGEENYAIRRRLNWDGCKVMEFRVVNRLIGAKEGMILM